MSQQFTNGSREYAQSYPKSYISTKPFNGEFYTYSTSLTAKLQTIGILAVSSASASICPAGRVLHLTGKKLIPGINDMTVLPLSLTAPTILFAVYDPISFLNGFIDLTSSTFAQYDQNVSNTIGNSVAFGGQGAKLNIGPSAQTGGDVGDASVGTVMLSGVAAGGGASITTSVYNSTTSKVFLTAISNLGGSGACSVYYSIPVGTPNTFNISSFGTAQLNTRVNWMVVN